MKSNFNSVFAAFALGMLCLGVRVDAGIQQRRAQRFRSAEIIARDTQSIGWASKLQPKIREAQTDGESQKPPQTAPFDYENQKVRGVNLGGWLLLEPWITPSLFEEHGLNSGMVDEFTLSRGLGKAGTVERLTPHWETWITLSDLQKIKDYGMNHIRIPVGYWAVEPLEGDPYVQGQLPYLDRAIQWARQVGLKVWVDLHGAPGSQNGFDNSGQRDRLQWQSTPGFVEHTLKVVGMLSERYATAELADVVAGIEILNEPLGPALDMNKIRQFWQDGYREVQSKSTNPSVLKVFGDAFQPIRTWNGFMNPPEYNNVLLDVHHYQVFNPGVLQMAEQQHIAQACAVGLEIRGMDKWTIVGEWSGAFTDCAKWLNGYPTKSRYEGQFGGSPYIGDCGRKGLGRVAELPQGEQDRIRRFIEAQLDAYEQGTGWIFWTWKTEGTAPEWDMQDLLDHGVFPRPADPSDRRWPGQCGF